MLRFSFAPFVTHSQLDETVDSTDYIDGLGWNNRENIKYNLADNVNLQETS